VVRLGLAGLTVFVSLTASAYALQGPQVSGAEVKSQIIAESIASYKSTGHPCACPYDSARNGSSCGTRSAYSRPGGAAPLCYAADVTPGMVLDWRRRH
jgi:hypothetical protein